MIEVRTPGDGSWDANARDRHSFFNALSLFSMSFFVKRLATFSMCFADGSATCIHDKSSNEIKSISQDISCNWQQDLQTHKNGQKLVLRTIWSTSPTNGVFY